MKYKVDDVKVVVIEDETLVAGSVGVHYAEFTFDESWDGYAKTAVFRNGNVMVEVIVVDGKCKIPWEVLANSGTLYVGVRGESGDKQRPALWAARKTVHEGAGRDEEERLPTPDIYQQLLNLIFNIEEGKTPELRLKGKTVYWKYTHEDESKWRELVTVVDGKDGAQGPQGIQGVPGADGFSPTINTMHAGRAHIVNITDAEGTKSFEVVDGETPIKGVDYYTEAEKAEMIDAVLAALPYGDEASY